MEDKYLIQIKDNQITGYSNLPIIDEGVYNSEVTEELYNDYVEYPDKYIVGEKEIEVDVPEFETVEEIIVDDEGNEQTIEVQRPVMIEVEETITVIDYDDEGNPIGEHEETVTKQVQKTHKETVTVPYPVVDKNYNKKQKQKREAEFNKAFFATSLGYIRRSVTMADGSKKDFLSDLLPVISMAVQSGQAVTILAYNKPPFNEDITDWKPYQKQETATVQFINECFTQLSNDFLPSNEG